MSKRANGEGTVYKSADGRWTASVTIGYANGRRQSKAIYGKTQAEVTKAKAKLLQSLDIDFAGNRIGALLREEPNDVVTFILTASGGRGMVAFTWLGEDSPALGLAKSFAALPDEGLADAAIRFAYEYSENLYASPAWWESMRKEDRDQLVARMQYTASPFNQRETDALVDDGLHLGDFGRIQRTTNVLSLDG